MAVFTLFLSTSMTCAALFSLWETEHRKSGVCEVQIGYTEWWHNSNNDHKWGYISLELNKALVSLLSRSRSVQIKLTWGKVQHRSTQAEIQVNIKHAHGPHGVFNSFQQLIFHDSIFGTKQQMESAPVNTILWKNPKLFWPHQVTNNPTTPATQKKIFVCNESGHQLLVLLLETEILLTQMMTASSCLDHVQNATSKHKNDHLCTSSYWSEQAFCTSSYWSEQAFCTSSYWSEQAFCTSSYWSEQAYQASGEGTFLIKCSEFEFDPIPWHTHTPTHTHMQCKKNQSYAPLLPPIQNTNQRSFSLPHFLTECFCTLWFTTLFDAKPPKSNFCNCNAPTKANLHAEQV